MTSYEVLNRAALLAVVLVTAGCGSVERAGGPQPSSVSRYLVYEKVTGEQGVWIADVDGSHPRLLVPDGHAPVISPDGRWVAYLGNCSEATGRCSLYLVSSTTVEKPKLLAGGMYVGLVWSPDSERLTGLQASPPANTELVSIDVARGDHAALDKGAFRGWSFSSDGRRIVYALAPKESAEGWTEEQIDLFVTDRAGGKAKRITESGDNAFPVWGPKSIAFAKLISCLPGSGPPASLAGCKNGAWRRDEIWQIQPDGSDRRTITGPLPGRLQAQGFTGLTPVSWSDDGRALLSCWSNEWGCVPMAVDPATGSARQLDEAQGSDPVALSRDGQLALIGGGGGGEVSPDDYLVMIVPYGGGKPKIVARGAWAPSWNR